MTFRIRLFLAFMLAAALAAGVVAVGAIVSTRQVFDSQNAAYATAVAGEFQHEFERRGNEVVQQIKNIGDAEGTIRMAIDLSRPDADVSVYNHDAIGLSAERQLAFLDFVGADGSLISSAESPSQIGGKLEWVIQPQDWAKVGPFLMRVDTDAGPAVGLMAVSVVRIGQKDLYIAGGERLDKDFLSLLAMPAGMRALLYRNVDSTFSPTNMSDAGGIAVDIDRLAPLIEQEIKTPAKETTKVAWTRDAASAETFHLVPLFGREKELLAVLLIESSQRQMTLLESRMILLAAAAAGGGLLFAILVSWWAGKRVTSPVQKIIQAADQVTAGNLRTHVDVRSHDEMGKLAHAFNRMTHQIADRREKGAQSERVAAWRELASRLSDELRDPITRIEAALTGREQAPATHGNATRECASALLSGVEDLKTVIDRFNEVAKMAHPNLQPVNLNDLIRSLIKRYEPRFGALGRPPITPELHLEESLPAIQADPALLQRALENLVLNAMDAMPSGGLIAVTTSNHDGVVRLEFADTGAGLTPEECQRLFTPYYTTKPNGTGLGLTIAQSVISDHGGSIAVESEKGVGTTFRIDLPFAPAKASKAPVEPAKPKSTAAIPQEVSL